MGRYLRNKFRRACRLWVRRSYKVKGVPVRGAAAWERGGGAGQQVDRLRQRRWGKSRKTKRKWEETKKGR